MSKRLLTYLSVAFLLSLVGVALAGWEAQAAAKTGQSGSPPSFPVAQHADASIEWWYLYAHVKTASGRHLAVVGSFFQFGAGLSARGPQASVSRPHYLIYAVTDLDTKAHRSYSLGDRNMLAMLEEAAPILAASSKKGSPAAAAATSLMAGRLPPPHRLIDGDCRITDQPFKIAYGPRDSLSKNGADFTLDLDDGGPDRIHIALSSLKPPMAVGGKGETGLHAPGDMHYFSLTRCRVAGTIDTGAGDETIAAGQGWVDHQWGVSWAMPDDGWDWWGVQLEDGRDILLFRHRDLATGRIYAPMATIMDRNGNQSVFHKVQFSIDPASLWKSPRTGAAYPLRWKITVPEAHLQLTISPLAPDQEMPILGPARAIWEGACRVELGTRIEELGMSSGGFAYMELVGYGNPAVRR
jgi:predicted secreted hydrolase